MRPVRVLLFNLAIIFVGGALLAPFLYWLVHAFADTFPEFVGKPFRRYVSRTLMLMALIRLWPLFRDLGATNLKEIGLSAPLIHWRRFVQGLSVGIASFAVVVVAAIAFGGRGVREDLTLANFASHLPTIVPIMLVVAVLEESLFRGAIFGGLQRSWHWVVAALVSGMLYAFAHFIGSVEHTGAVRLWSGFTVVAGMFGGLFDPERLLPEFLNLTGVGVILAWGFRRTGNLYFSIGLHAGWIFWVKACAVITVPAATTNAVIWGSRKLIDGWVILLALIAAGLLTRLMPLNRKPAARRPTTRDAESTVEP